MSDSTGAAFVESNIYGAGEGNILLDDLKCRGTETSLSQCVHRGLYTHNCGHLEDVGVICNTGKIMIIVLKSFLYLYYSN